MGRRVFGGARPIALLAMTIGTMLGTSGLAPPESVPEPLEVEAVAGAGIIDKAMCLGCAAALFGAGGGTLGGLLLEATFFPEAFGACAYTCVAAFAE